LFISLYFSYISNTKSMKVWEETNYYSIFNIKAEPTNISNEFSIILVRCSNFFHNLWIQWMYWEATIQAINQKLRKKIWNSYKTVSWLYSMDSNQILEWNSFQANWRSFYQIISWRKGIWPQDITSNLR